MGESICCLWLMLFQWIMVRFFAKKQTKKKLARHMWTARWLSSELISYLANGSYTANVNNADVNITSLSLIFLWQFRLFAYFNAAFQPSYNGLWQKGAYTATVEDAMFVSVFVWSLLRDWWVSTGLTPPTQDNAQCACLPSLSAWSLLGAAHGKPF